MYLTSEDIFLDFLLFEINELFILYISVAFYSELLRHVYELCFLICLKSTPNRQVITANPRN